MRVDVACGGVQGGEKAVLFTKWPMKEAEVQTQLRPHPSRKTSHLLSRAVYCLVFSDKHLKEF